MNTSSNQHEIYAYGDSLTEQDYTSALQKLLPSNVVAKNLGMSGQSSGIIAVREGGILIKSLAFEIPNFGAVQFEPYPSVKPWNVGQVGAARMMGSFVGVSGETSRDPISGKWIFTRSNAGTSVKVAAGTPFRSSTAESSRHGLLITWIGRNDVAFGWPTQRSGVVAATAAMIAHLTPQEKKFLVISVTTATSEGKSSAGYTTVLDINAGLRSRWPKNFVDVRKHIIVDGLKEAGITPTAADLAAVGRDTLPPSLMTDDIHPNAICRDLVIAPFVYQALFQRGWVTR